MTNTIQYSNMKWCEGIDPSIDGLVLGKIHRTKPIFNGKICENPYFPVDFPLNQSIEEEKIPLKCAALAPALAKEVVSQCSVAEFIQNFGFVLDVNGFTWIYI